MHSGDTVRALAYLEILLLMARKEPLSPSLLCVTFRCKNLIIDGALDNPAAFEKARRVLELAHLVTERPEGIHYEVEA